LEAFLSTKSYDAYISSSVSIETNMLGGEMDYASSTSLS